MKWLLFILFLTILGTGCGTEDSQPKDDVSAAITPTTPLVIETQSPAIIAPTVESTKVDAQLPEPTESVVPTPLQATIAPGAEGEVGDEFVEPEATKEDVVVFNGTYENSFFRGAENAPVTLIDYSDFL